MIQQQPVQFRTCTSGTANCSSASLFWKARNGDVQNGRGRKSEEDSGYERRRDSATVLGRRGSGGEVGRARRLRPSDEPGIARKPLRRTRGGIPVKPDASISGYAGASVR